MAQGREGEGSACGKAILVGEHFVVYGAPALAIPLVDVRTRVRICSGVGDSLVLESPAGISQRDGAESLFKGALNVLGLPATGWHVSIDSDLPIGCGLGSSAALSLSFLRGLRPWCNASLSPDETNAAAFELERIAHGDPSGVDNTVVTYEEGVLYRKSQPWERLVIPSFTLVLADTGLRSLTADAVAQVRAWRGTSRLRFDALLQDSERDTHRLRLALEGADWEECGTLMDRAQKRLVEIGVSLPSLCHLAGAAKQAGALGAKLTGAGVGGCILALTRAGEGEKLSKALVQAGAKETWIISAGGRV